MAERDKTYKTIAVDEKTHQTIVKLAKEYGKSNMEFVGQMAKFFLKNGIDPNITPTNLAKEMKLLDKHLIGFIRKQEELFLIPIANNIQEQKAIAMKLLQNLEKLHGVKAESLPDDKVSLPKQTVDNITHIVHNIYKIAIKLKLTEGKKKTYEEARLLSEKLVTLIK